MTISSHRVRMPRSGIQWPRFTHPASAYTDCPKSLLKIGCLPCPTWAGPRGQAAGQSLLRDHRPERSEWQWRVRVVRRGKCSFSSPPLLIGQGRLTSDADGPGTCNAHRLFPLTTLSRRYRMFAVPYPYGRPSTARSGALATLGPTPTERLAKVTTSSSRGKGEALIPVISRQKRIAHFRFQWHRFS